MKTKILRIAILFVFLLLVFEGYSQINTRLNQLKGAGIITENQADSPEGNVSLKNQDVFKQKSNPYFTNEMALNESKSFFLKSTFKESLNYSETDLVYQRMEWEIDPNIRYIKGSVTSYFISQVDNLTKIEFDLNDTMRIDSVIQNKQKIDFSQNDNKLLIDLNRPLENMELDSVQVYYHGEPEISGYFVKDEHAGTPIIWTISEPYGAMEWWPCKQSLLDKIDSIDVFVTSPDSFRTASNGILVSDKAENGSRIMHWKHRHPIATYLVAIAVTNYAEYSDWLDLEDGRKIQILNYVYPENLESVKRETQVTAEFIQLYNQLFGEYPFANEKYGHAQIGGGTSMEQQTMSFMTFFDYGFVAHMLAYQWFGDYITCGSWHDIWLTQGFATYLTGLVYENFPNAYVVNWTGWKQYYLNDIISAPDGSVYVKDPTRLSAIFNGRLSNSKGAYLLHMLRWVLGDENFFKGMRSYFNDPELANGFALTSHFIKHMETAGDTSLTEFFNDWFYGEGYPIYSAGYTVANESDVKITLSQTTSHSSVDFFEMPVPVRVYNAENTAYKDFRLDHTSNNQEFTLNVDFKLGKVIIDPDYWLASKTLQIIDNNPVEDSYVKLVDRASNKSLSNANLTYYGTTIKSDINGFGVIKNFRNVTFSYSILHTRYFYEEGTIVLNPGDTVVLKLTAKKAKVEFVVEDEFGPVANQILIFNGKTVTTNEEGSAIFSNVDARKKYEYSLEASSYIAIQDSIFLEIDTVIHLMLEPITSVSELTSTDFTIYPNPFNDELFIQTNANREYSVELATITGRTIYQSKIDGNFHYIYLRELSSGIYFVRMKSNNFVSVRKVIKM
jgi:hypothetical protein